MRYMPPDMCALADTGMIVVWEINSQGVPVDPYTFAERCHALTYLREVATDIPVVYAPTFKERAERYVARAEMWDRTVIQEQARKFRQWGLTCP